MFRNYLITALRNLKRNKVYTLLNVFGLAMGIGCSLVIYKVISYEFSYDKHHEHYGEIYRVVNENIYPDQVDKGMGTPHPVGPAIQADMSNVKSVVRTNYVYGNQLNVYDGNGEMQKFMIDDGIAFTENSYFEIFTVEWIAGNPQTALTNPQSVVVSASEARKLFKLPAGMEQEALGKLINFNNLKDFKVVGVIEDPKEPTSLPFTYLFDYESQDEVNPYFGGGTSWNSTSSNTNTYFIPEDNFNPTAFNQEMIAFVEKHHGEGRSEDRRYLAQSFSEIHFDQEYGSYTGATSLQFLYALGLIGIFLVLTACINFVNLATAQASNRAKEIGIRKAIGSMTSQLLVQFLSEIALITFFAVVIALAIAEMMFNLLSDIIGYQLSVDLFGNPETFLFLFILFVVVSLLSGFYPAVLLSRMNTVQALKKKITSEAHSGGLSLRKGLVIVQFAISQFLIIGTLIVSSQSDYFLNKDLGFATEAILTTYLPERDVVKMERFRQAMLTSPSIESVTYGLSEPTGNSDSHSNINYAPLESEKDYHANFKPVDPYYTDFFDIEILAGRTVQEGDSNNVVINEKIARLMGLQKGEYDQAIGETLETGWGGNKTVVGVMEDFHTYSLEEDLDFVLLLHYPEAFYSLSFKTPSLASIDEAKAHFESVWNQVYPEYVLDYDFYDQSLAERYEDVQNITALMRIFAVISILIGCLGLYGLVSFIAMNRIKEIGVRKVLGATPLNILTIFSKEVVILMVISFVVTAPLAFYFLNLWLDNFSFRIDIGVSFFVTALITTLVIALLTISHKTIAAALINPAETLKDD